MCDMDVRRDGVTDHTKYLLVNLSLIFYSIELKIPDSMPQNWNYLVPNT